VRVAIIRQSSHIIQQARKVAQMERLIIVRHALTAVMLLAMAAAIRAQSIPDFSGSWVRDPARDVMLHRVDRVPHGWGPIPYTTGKQPFIVVIVQNTQQVNLAFPGGWNNFMNLRDAYQLDGKDVTTVRDLGQWWEKTVSRSTWDGGTLTLKAIRLIDWWKSTQPSEVTQQITETDTIFHLNLNPGQSELTIETTLSDEKGEVTYRQVFTKSTR
jgi:hypothetical protein